MKLRTSFFNITALKKDITRFAPLWGLYTIFQLLFILLLWESEESAARFMNNASGIMQAMGVLNFGYAGLCALVLFGDLFHSKMCNALHAMPLRREGWYLTHLVAGLSFCIVPNLLGTILASVFLQEYCYGAFLWLAVSVLQFVFFFGVGTFSMMCAGNRLGAAAMYGLINFFSVLAAWLIKTFYEPVLYGIQLDFEQFARFSPVVNFSLSAYIDTHYDNMLSITVLEKFLPEDWRYLYIAAAVGAVLLGLALLIYRKRRLETAGDFISTRPAAPFFLILYTLCVGAVMYFISEISSEGLRYIFLVIGFGIGFFTGKMLLERRVRVFQKKSWLAFGGLVLIFFFSITMTLLDPIGITRYIPEADQVASVQISPSSYADYMGRNCVMTEPEDIQTVIDVHRYAVDHRRPTGNTCYVHLEYRMKNGSTVSRFYTLETDSEACQALKPYYSSLRYVLGEEDLAQVMDDLNVLEFYPNIDKYPYVAIGGSEWVDPENTEKYGSDKEPFRLVLNGSFAQSEIAKGLLEAIAKDCEEGNIAQLWEYHDGYEHIGSISLQYEVSNYSIRYMDISIFEDCVHTIEYINALSPQT